MARQNPSGRDTRFNAVPCQLEGGGLPCDDLVGMSSAEPGREGRGPGNPRSSCACYQDCADLVHQMANATNAVLMNTQVLGWKLPPYSRLKRPLREIERNAQRAGELMKRLSRKLTEIAENEDEIFAETAKLENDTGVAPGDREQTAQCSDEA